MINNGKENKRAVLIAVNTGRYDVDETLEELSLLCKTLNIEVADRIVQKRTRPDPVSYIGKGKLEKVRNLMRIYGADLVITDDEITPVQAKNISDITGADVLDRTQIILEIFARHATTEEGKLQVELAKLQYELPRFVGKGKELSRLGGGIGTRGPGEQYIRQKRSEIRKRIAILKKRIEEISVERRVQRKKRKRSGIPRVSIAGYTNAGKSSLLNLLVGSDDAIVEDKLFATLEPLTRRVKIPSGRVVLFSDTVGFIRKLPHTIIAAFKATLEEIKESDLILHLVDASDPFYKNKLQESLKVLEEINAISIPRITTFNKIDLLPSERLFTIMNDYPEAVFISVKKHQGIDSLLERIDYELSKVEEEVKIRVPIKFTGMIYSSFDKAVIVSEKFVDGSAEFIIKGKREVIEEVVGKAKGEVIS